VQTRGIHFAAAKLGVFFVLFIIQMFLLAPSVLGYTTEDSTCVCNESCEDCSFALADPACSTVLLSENLDGGATASCIGSFNDKTFDCQGNEISGGWNYGINLSGSSGAIVKNCTLRGHLYPVFVHNSSNVSLTDINILDTRGESRVQSSTGINIERLRIQNSPDDGLVINSTSNLVLRDSHFEGAAFWGVYSGGLSNSTIEGCTATNNGHGGLTVSGSNNQILGNRIYSHANRGMTVSGPGMILKDNILEDNGFNFGVGGGTLDDFASMDIDQSNTINGKPVIYWVGVENVSVPSNAGYVGIINSQSVTVSGLEITENSQGVLFVGTHDSVIEQMKLYGNLSEIDMRFSERNTVRNNIIGDIELYPYDGYAIAISLSSSNSNNITGNVISQHGTGVGISNYSQYNLITDNTIFANSWCFNLNYVSNNRIENNTITGCGNDGIRLGSFTNYNEVIGNTITGTSLRGLSIYHSDNNIVNGNEIIDNFYGISMTYGSGNILTDNYVLENESGLNLDSFSSGNALNDNFFCQNINHNRVSTDDCTDDPGDRFFKCYPPLPRSAHCCPQPGRDPRPGRDRPGPRCWSGRRPAQHSVRLRVANCTLACPCRTGQAHR